MSKGLAATRQSKKKAQSASTPKADSLVTILEQALQSSDDALLEECLAVSDQRVVDLTVERLPSVRVLPFLLRLTDKVERRPNRGMNLCIW